MSSSVDSYRYILKADAMRKKLEFTNQVEAPTNREKAYTSA